MRPPVISDASWTGYYTNYFIGEKAGADLIWKLEDFSPGPVEKAWVRTWASEEDHHHELWASLAKRKGIAIQNLPSTFEGLYAKTSQFVHQKDWIGSVTGAAIIEHISSAAAEYLMPFADADTQAVFRKIVADDVRHIAFDVSQMQKIAQTPEGRSRLWQVHKAFMPVILEWPLHPHLLDGEIDIINAAYRTHREKVNAMGVPLPDIRFAKDAAYRLQKKALEMAAKFI